MATPGKRYEFNVQMACPGCSGAVERALKKLPNISKLDVSLKEQSVKVDTTLPFEQVQQAIKKTGKTVTSGRVVGDAPAPAVAKANAPKPAVVA